MQKFQNNDSIEIKFNNRQLIPLLTIIALFLGIFIGGTLVWLLGILSNKNDKYNLNSGDNSDFYNSEYISEIITILEEKYLGDVSEVSKEDVTYGMVKGLISSLGDKYTNFLDPNETEEYISQSTGNFEGIGVTLASDGTYVYVESLLKDHPAEKAGILPQDIILKVDGEDVVSLLPSAVASRIRGEKDTEVTLTLARPSQNINEQQGEFDITIKRAVIEQDNIMWEKKDEKTAVIEIVQFNDASVADFNRSWDKVVGEIESQMPGLENIVVDLRGNPGGYVFGVKYVIEEFLGNGEIIMKERTKNEDEEVFTDTRNGSFEEVDLVVLVNEGSASASEIFAAAIQDNDRGEVIGMKTVGKGVEQDVIDLPDGSLLFVVFQQWLTPDGRNINPETPITPDIEIDLTMEDYKAKKDPQLDKALEVLSQ